MTPVFSFRDLYKKLNNPEFTIWVLYWIGAIKYDTIEKKHTVNIRFLPKTFSKQIAKSQLDWREIRRHTKSLNVPIDILPDLVIGQEYSLDGEFHENAYKKSSYKELELNIHNPSALELKTYYQINEEYKPNYTFPIDLEFYGNQPFIEFRSHAEKRIVLFPCFELARYFFFTAKYITKEIVTGSLIDEDKMAIIEKISITENGKRSCIVALTNRFKDNKSKYIAARLMFDPVFKKTVHLISSKFKKKFNPMSNSFHQNSTAFTHCSLPYNEAIKISVSFVELGTSADQTPIVMVNQILKVSENHCPFDQYNVLLLYDTRPGTDEEARSKMEPKNVQRRSNKETPTKQAGASLLVDEKPNLDSSENYIIQANIDGSWLNDSVKQVILDKTEQKGRYSTHPIIKRYLKRGISIEEGGDVNSPYSQSDIIVEYKKSQKAYIEAIFSELAIAGWRFKFHCSLDEERFVTESVQITVKHEVYSVIIAEASINKGARSYSFFVIECIDFSRQPHYTAIIHNSSLTSVNISDLRKIVEKAKEHKFIWKRCELYIKSMDLVLEKKEHQQHDVSALANKFKKCFNTAITKADFLL